MERPQDGRGSVNAARPSMGAADAPNWNALWARLAFEEWRRRGLSMAVVCPGSRSAPLAAAVAALRGVPTIIAHDERGGAFAALGAARATGRAAAVVTTSGTAVANLLPAAVEASKTGTPLLLVTADRPPELHGCGANQCIRQQGIFGSFAAWSVEMPCAGVDVPLSWLLATAGEAWDRAHAPSHAAGPVHINWAFREPLAPIVQPWDRASLGEIERWLDGDRPWRDPIAQGSVDAVAAQVIDGARAFASRAQQPILCVGPLYSPGMRAVADRVAAALGWPVLADIGSGLRSVRTCVNAIRHADLIVLDRDAAPQLPDAIVRVGALHASRRVNEWVSSALGQGARLMLVRTTAEPADPDRAASAELVVDVRADVPAAARDSQAVPTVAARAPHHSSAAWKRADEVVDGVLRAALDGDADAPIDEPSTARIVSESAPSGCTLLLGNSMPVRDADMHAPWMNEGVPIAVSRGASGIDGMLATAVGHAKATGEPTIALLGDITMLHDLSSLALASTSGAGVVIVVVNNDGGGIFHFLPLQQHPALLEPWSTAPQGADFSAAAKIFGMSFAQPQRRGELRGALDRSLADARNGRCTLIEVRTNRAENLAFHRSLQAQVTAALHEPRVNAAPCRPLVLVHGFLGSPDDWCPFERALREIPHAPPTIRADLLGAARALIAAGNAKPSLPQLACALLGALRRDPRLQGGFDVLGYSLGGRVALEWMVPQQGAAAGANDIRVMLASAHPGLDDEAERSQRANADARFAEQLAAIDGARTADERDSRIASLLDAWYSTPMFAPLTSAPAFNLILQRRREDLQSSGTASCWAAIVAGCSPGSNEPRWNALQAAGDACTVVTGERDARYCAVMQRSGHLGIATRMIKDAGHALPMEKPEALARLAAAWAAPHGSAHETIDTGSTHQTGLA